MTMKAALIQMNVMSDKPANLRKARQLIDRACEDHTVDLIDLPECFTFFWGHARRATCVRRALPRGR